VTRRVDASPVALLQLLGDDLRWQLLLHLAESDRRVGELAKLTGGAQNLVSYHLRQLSRAGLVVERRSSADGRDVYYHLDARRCGALLAATGSALHPGLRLVDDDAELASRNRGRPARVLFLCTGNSARSLLAEALLRHLSRGQVEACSAGTAPAGVHPQVPQALAEVGVDASGLRSKHLDELAGERFDYVISLCDLVREACPQLQGEPKLVHWSLPDPVRSGASDEETLVALRELVSDLTGRIRILLLRMARTAGWP